MRDHGRLFRDHRQIHEHGQGRLGGTRLFEHRPDAFRDELRGGHSGDRRQALAGGALRAGGGEGGVIVRR